MSKQSRFSALVAAIKAHACSLQGNRIQAVPGEGSIDSPVVFIGEAPGAEEDRQGRPFVGASGRLLETGLNGAGWKREAVYITNVVKCRPPDNRRPTAREVAEHRPLLEQELELIQPLLIVPLGLTAVRFFLPKVRLADVRGQLEQADGRNLFATYHPAATFRYRDKREAFLADMQAIPSLLKTLR
jgi:DNA polymerase